MWKCAASKATSCLDTRHKYCSFVNDNDFHIDAHIIIVVILSNIYVDLNFATVFHAERWWHISGHMTMQRSL